MFLLQLRKQVESDWSNAQGIVASTLGIEPMVLEVWVKPEEGGEPDKRTPDQLVTEVAENMESK